MVFDWGVVAYAAPLPAEGSVITLQISVLVGILGLALGFLLGLYYYALITALATAGSCPHGERGMVRRAW